MEHIYHKIAEEILENSISVNDQIIDLETVVALREEATTDYENGAFEKARIGKGIGKQRIAEIRGDQVRWLDKNRATQAHLTYWKWIDGLRNYLSEFFRIHLERTELHFAYYPKGAFYSRHLDQFKEHSDRIFSIILYLNTEWKPGDGGELRAYEKDDSFTDYPPLGGRLIIFRSDVVEHEVLEAHAPRISVTGWIRRDKLIY
ncbi:MAG: 2OG-Fe(II) oxygenase [Salibacteraceae bacterium]|nr:2OG-Fe(II) oxygenase [Salibacteraceae bacterium]